MTNSSETINLPLKMNTVHYLTILYFLLISLSELSAQNNGDFPTSLRICSDNDFYKMRDGTDRYYSSGLTAEFQPGTRQERIGLKAAFPRLSSCRTAETILRYGFLMQTYTPENIYDLSGQQRSRPYCGLTMLSLSGVSNSLAKQHRLSTSYSAGLMGPLTMQNELQMWYHRKTGRRQPLGWENQIANDLALNAALLYERNIWRPVSNFELIGMAEGNCGTVMNFAGLGVQCRLGFLNDYFSNVMGFSPGSASNNNNPETKAIENKFIRYQFYFFGKSVGRMVYDNSLLEAGYFNFRNSPYKLGKEEIEKFYAQFEFGYVFSCRRFSLTFSQTFRTKEFKTGKTAQWGSITMACQL